MKKALFVLLAFLVLFSFVSCAEEHEHSWDEGTTFIEASCTENGYKIFKCSCGAIKYETIEASGAHTWDKGTVVSDSTCSNYGAKLFTCTCGTQKIEVIEKKPHGDAKADTAVYNGDGYLYDACSICGAKLEDKSTLDKTTLKNLIVSFPALIIYSSYYKDYTNLKSVYIDSDLCMWIQAEAFSGCNSLESITIPKTVTMIENKAFENCTSLATINYTGTKEDWAKIKPGTDWNKNVPATVVHCSDGDYTL